MIRITTTADLERDLTQDLLNESKPEDRCPHFKFDKIGSYCSRDLSEGEPILEIRRDVCNNASLQLWCLDKYRYSICIWYRGEPFR